MKGQWCRLRSLTLVLLLALLVLSLYPAPSFAVHSSAMDDVSTLPSVPSPVPLLSTAVRTPLRPLLKVGGQVASVYYPTDCAGSSRSR
jgi:hypothetical protein